MIKYKKYGKIRIAIRIKGKMRRNVMEHNKDIQAAFMDALNALKEYAKVNGNIVGKEDVAGFFKDMSLDDNKYSMITGYLMANGITIKGEDGTDNEFLHMLESTVDDSVKNDEKGIALENEYKSTEDDAFTEKQVTDKDGLITKINISEEEVKSLPEKETKRLCTIPIIASINCFSSSEWTDFARTMQDAGADALELNILSLQTEKEYQYGAFEQRHIDILSSVKKHVSIPVIIKLGTNLTNPIALINQLYANGAAAVLLFLKL